MMNTSFSNKQLSSCCCSTSGLDNPSDFGVPSKQVRALFVKIYFGVTTSSLGQAERWIQSLALGMALQVGNTICDLIKPQ